MNSLKRASLVLMALGLTALVSFNLGLNTQYNTHLWSMITRQQDPPTFTPEEYELYFENGKKQFALPTTTTNKGLSK